MIMVNYVDMCSCTILVVANVCAILWFGSAFPVHHILNTSFHVLYACMCTSRVIWMVFLCEILLCQVCAIQPTTTVVHVHIYCMCGMCFYMDGLCVPHNFLWIDARIHQNRP